VIVQTRAEDLVEWRGIVGFVRGTNTPFSQKVVEASDAGATRLELSGLYNRIWSDMRNGTIDESCVCMSDCVNSITSIKTCKEIVDELSAAFVS
jgi:F0F1-type ATP synthase gamma subunit